MNTHMAYTWLWSNMLHPFIFLIVFDEISFLQTNTIATILSVMVYSLLVSLPSLFISQLAGYFILKMRTSVTVQFLVWLFLAPMIVLLNFIFLFLLVGVNTLSELDPKIAVPAVIAVTIVISLRYHSFFKACIPVIQEQQEKEN